VPINGAQTCYYPAFGNVSENNQFSDNGGFHNPSNGDVGLSTAAHDPGNCFSGDGVPDGTDPAGIETSPLYRPANGMCTKPNSGDLAVLGSQVACASQIVGPCPSVPNGTSYPRPSSQFSLGGVPVKPLEPYPQATANMPDPCSGVPQNPWCP
jgi:hypothetical protein